jgi:hypothetical protein
MLPAEQTAQKQPPLDKQYFGRTAMLNMHLDEWRSSRVTVAFEDGALSFMLSKDATFEDLADCLDRLGDRHHGKPVAIEVKLAAAFDAQRRRLVSGLGRDIGNARIEKGHLIRPRADRG